MAMVTKCDRCGNIYEPKNKQFRFAESFVPYYMILANNGSTTLSYDLCDSCMADLADFMAMKPSVIKGERQIAHWNHSDDKRDYYDFYCSNCHECNDSATEYCPHCGAKMLRKESY